MKQRTLVIIKPDAVVKCLAGNVISDLYNTNLKMIGLKLVNVQKELAEKHYEEHKDKPFFGKLVKHITGELHENENVIAIVYEGKDAIKIIRDAAGDMHPEQSNPKSIRGKYGRIHSQTDCFENVIHASDSPESAEREINLWFDEKELVK